MITEVVELGRKPGEILGRAEKAVDAALDSWRTNRLNKWRGELEIIKQVSGNEGLEYARGRAERFDKWSSVLGKGGLLLNLASFVLSEPGGIARKVAMGSIIVGGTVTVLLGKRLDERINLIKSALGIGRK